MKKCEDCKNKRDEPFPHCEMTARDLSEYPEDGDCANYETGETK